MQYRLLVGMREFNPGMGKDLLEQLQKEKDGKPEQRLRAAVVVGELGTPAQALEKLDQLTKEAGPELSADQKRVAELLRRLYTAYNANKFEDVLTEPEQTFLRKELG